MADDTFESRLLGTTWGGPAGVKHHVSDLVKIGEAGIYPGMAVRVVNGVMYLAKASDLHFSGIAMEMPGQSPDEVYTYSASVPNYGQYYPKGKGQDIWCRMAPAAGPVPAKEQEDVYLSTTDGELQVGTGGTYYTDGAEATDFPTNRVGSVAKYDAGHATDMHLVKVTV